MLLSQKKKKNKNKKNKCVEWIVGVPAAYRKMFAEMQYPKMY